MVETLSLTQNEGRSWAVCEAPTPQYEAMQKFKGPSGAFLNELVTQLQYQNRKFYLLTNTGLTTVTKQRPLDVLLQLMINSDGAAINDFAERFGLDQFCGMCLAIACGHSSISGGPYMIPKNIAGIASTLFFDFGGMPIADPKFNAMAKTPGMHVHIIHSAKHNALSLYLARLLRPIWKNDLVKKSVVGASKKTALVSGLNIEELVSVQLNLQSLQTYLAKYPNFSATPSPEIRPLNIDADVWKTEQQSLANMRDLLIQSIEAISFISLLIDFNIGKVSSKLSVQEQAELCALNFESLVSSTQGRAVSKSLMTALINIQLDNDADVESIINTLKDKCPTICEDNDTIIFKVLRFLTFRDLNLFKMLVPYPTVRHKKLFFTKL